MVTVLHEGKLGQEPIVRSWSRDHGEMLRTGLLLMIFTACFLTARRNTSPVIAPQWAGPSHIRHQLRKWTTGKSGGDICSFELSLSKMKIRQHNWEMAYQGFSDQPLRLIEKQTKTSGGWACPSHGVCVWIVGFVFSSFGGLHPVLK